MPSLRLHVVVGLSLAVTAGVASVVGAAPAPRPNTFECEMLIRTAAYGVLERSQLTTKGELMRYQKRTGAGLKIVFIRNRQGTYHLNMHTNDGAKWPAAWAKDVEKRMVNGGPSGDPQAFFKLVQAKRTGRETVNGRATEVWTYDLPTKAGRPEVVHVYLDAREKRPVKAEMRMPVAPGKVEKLIIEYPRYRWGFALADSFFNLPAGAKVVDLGKADLNKMKGPGPGMPGVPGAGKPEEKPVPVKRAGA